MQKDTKSDKFAGSTRKKTYITIIYFENGYLIPQKLFHILDARILFSPTLAMWLAKRKSKIKHRSILMKI